MMVRWSGEQWTSGEFQVNVKSQFELDIGIGGRMQVDVQLVYADTVLVLMQRSIKS